MAWASRDPCKRKFRSNSPLASAGQKPDHVHMRCRTVSILCFIGVIVAGETVMFGADFQFRHHFISREMPITDKSVGDYGLTALVDVDRDGDLDFVLGGRPFKPSQLYWFEFQSPDQWVQHVVGTNFLSD